MSKSVFDLPVPGADLPLGLYPIPNHPDMGARIWAPEARSVEILLWPPEHPPWDVSASGEEQGEGVMNGGVGWVEQPPGEVHRAQYHPVTGCWDMRLHGYSRFEGWYYRYSVEREGIAYPVLDPWARVVSPSPRRDSQANYGVVFLDLDEPAGKDTLHLGTSRRSESVEQAGSGTVSSPNQIIIYELHVRDMTIWPESGVSQEHRGTWRGLSEKLEYIRDLGVSHIQLLPVMKSASVNSWYTSTTASETDYNWGYDPLHYFALEPWFGPGTRVSQLIQGIRDFRSFVQRAHKLGLAVILDVVYNHMAATTWLDPLCPGYFFRHNPDGSLSSNSGCGNDLATELPMTRRLILDSVSYWLDFMGVDGFRFDLMGLVDEQTMLEVQRRVARKGGLLIGEGWRMYNGRHGTRGMDQDRLVEDQGIRMFNDEYRDLMKGGGMNERAVGVLTGPQSMEDGKHLEALYSNIAGQGVYHIPNKNPSQLVQYLVCHDGLTLHDSIAMNCRLDPGNPLHRELLIRRLCLAHLIQATSQGLMFLHAGQERGRSKPNIGDDRHEAMGRFIRNSYNAGDQVNRFPWQTAQGFEALTQAVRDFVTFRRSQSLLGLTTKAEVEACYRPLPNLPPSCLGFALNPSRDLKALPEADEGSTLVVVVNLGEQSREIPAKVFDALGLISRRLGIEPWVALDIWGKPEDGVRTPDGITINSDGTIYLSALSGGVIIL